MRGRSLFPFRVIFEHLVLFLFYILLFYRSKKKIFYLYLSLWAFYTNGFRGVPLLVLQLNWLAACDSLL